MGRHSFDWLIFDDLPVIARFQAATINRNSGENPNDRKRNSGNGKDSKNINNGEESENHGGNGGGGGGNSGEADVDDSQFVRVLSVAKAEEDKGNKHYQSFYINALLSAKINNEAILNFSIEFDQCGIGEMLNKNVNHLRNVVFVSKGAYSPRQIGPKDYEIPKGLKIKFLQMMKTCPQITHELEVSFNNGINFNEELANLANNLKEDLRILNLNFEGNTNPLD
ncbi:hypothetical protein F8M41_003345 [Gigaspora margarita]|uniref:Uncharacterized protein n=1 Tax=Gigaspora margarita TaxID=4874 RepID=A0A8H4A7I4_GIGMA|nr:hypothetical protein F8M41_003345 [Gigaspora margarita]